LRARAQGGMMAFNSVLMAHINDESEPGTARFDIGEVIRGLYTIDQAEGSVMIDEEGNVIFV
jgi:hypothetical protein